MILIRNPYFKYLALPAVLFICLLPVSLLVNFYQNDDWCYYMTVERFSLGNFTLHPYVGPTFYLQGFMGMLFSKVFGISHLPVLTLLVACVSLYFFIIILNEFLKIDFKWSLVLGTLFFANPLGVYELWGYMTNHYFMLFLLSAFYLFLKYEKTLEKKYNVGYSILVFLGLLVRQTALVLPIVVSLHYLLKNKFKLSAFNFSYFVLLYAFYSKLLPLTPRIHEVPLQFQHVLKFDYAYAVIYGSLLIITAYLLPLVLNAVDFRSIFVKKAKVALFIILIVLVFLGFNNLFKPSTISWGEFPYFENVVERAGFYPRGVHGTKYYFAGNFELWKDWDLAAKVTLAIFISYLILHFRKKLNIYSLYLIVYLALMVITETYYDRYIYTVIPIAIFYLLSISDGLKRYTKLMLLGYLIGLVFLSYLFSADFILVNRYIWNRSLSLVTEKKVLPEDILGTNAWKLTYRNVPRDYIYNFSYDSTEVNQTYRDDYTLVEFRAINFPLNIFVNPTIYLYEKIQR